MKSDNATALLVRGQDRHAHYGEDVPATVDLDPAALARHQVLQREYIETVARS